MRRVAITGMGAVTARGATLEETRAALAAENDADRPHAPEPDFRAHFTSPKALKLCDRRTRLAVAAAAMALRDARPSTALDGERLGVYVGTSGSDLGAEELARALSRSEADSDRLRAVNETPLFAERVLAGVSPLWLLVHLPNMASAHVAIQLEARGPNSTVMTGWIAGLQAILEAVETIREGAADAMIAGGAECAVHPFAEAGFEQAGLLERGLVPGEGAALFLLEERETAFRRGARILAEVEGGETHVTPDSGGFDAVVDGLRGRLGHLMAAEAPLRLALALLDADGDTRVAVKAGGPFGERTSLTLRAEARVEASIAERRTA